VSADHEYRVVSSRKRFTGGIFRVMTDVVEMPGGGTAVRDVTRHLGAVAVVALDDDGRVVLIRQYRHAVGTYLWEIPAGLLDVVGESGVGAAARELAEEVDLAAADWHLLADLYTSPGFSDELVRVYLARGLRPVPADERHVRGQEEADLTVAWLELDEAVAMVLRGEITNGLSAAGLLAAARARDQDWAPLRPAEESGPASTGPASTGPASTGPASTGPASTVDTSSAVDGPVRQRAARRT
jgi:8-oxo-dGTP pyrophosphatase MutT (NUDIX family)